MAVIGHLAEIWISHTYGTLQALPHRRETVGLGEEPWTEPGGLDLQWPCASSGGAWNRLDNFYELWFWSSCKMKMILPVPQSCSRY